MVIGTINNHNQYYLLHNTMDELIQLEKQAELLEQERLRAIRAIQRQRRRLHREKKELKTKLDTLDTYKLVLNTKTPQQQNNNSNPT
jgi:hypothetical protein